MPPNGGGYGPTRRMSGSAMASAKRFRSLTRPGGRLTRSMSIDARVRVQERPLPELQRQQCPDPQGVVLMPDAIRRNQSPDLGGFEQPSPFDRFRGQEVVDQGLQLSDQPGA